MSISGIEEYIEGLGGIYQATDRFLLGEMTPEEALTFSKIMNINVTLALAITLEARTSRKKDATE